jgi:hypothetical protein
MLDFHHVVSTGSHDDELCAGFLGKAEDRLWPLRPRFEGFVAAILGIPLRLNKEVGTNRPGRLISP